MYTDTSLRTYSMSFIQSFSQAYPYRLIRRAVGIVSEPS